MAQKNPYDPEAGIIDLFEIVDDPEAAPETEGFGAVRDGQAGVAAGHPDERPEGHSGESLGEPREGEQPEEAAEMLASSRYPFENSEEFFEGPVPSSEGCATGGLPEQNAPVSEEAFVSEEPSLPSQPVQPPHQEDALIRAFEQEMAKAGSGALGTDMPEPEADPMQEDAAVAGTAGDAVGAQDEEERENGIPAVPAEELTEDAPAPAEEALCRTEEIEAAATDEAADEGSLPVLNMFEEAEKSVAGKMADAGEADAGHEPAAFPSEPLSRPACPVSAGEPVAGLGGSGGGLGGCLTEAGMPDGDAVEERLIRLEEALSRLNERVADLERRVEDSEEQVPALSALSGDMQSLLTEGAALCGQLKALSASFESAPEPEAVEVLSAEAPESAAPEEEEPDVFGLALESLEQRVSVLEQRPVPVSDTAGIAQDVLALVRVDMEKNTEEQDAVARMVAQLQHRVDDLEARPLPQLILPELPDAEVITADVMDRIQGEVDRVAAEAAARVLREEIASLLQK